ATVFRFLARPEKSAGYSRARTASRAATRGEGSAALPVPLAPTGVLVALDAPLEPGRASGRGILERGRREVDRDLEQAQEARAWQAVGGSPPRWNAPFEPWALSAATSERWPSWLSLGS